MVMSKSPGTLFILLLGLNILLTDAVWELDKSNFEKFRQMATFPIFFVDSPSCSRCRLLYPFFYAASQMFVGDREVFFGRVQDKALIRHWEIEELPVILYYEKGDTEWQVLEGDITVENIVDTIADNMPSFSADIKLDHVIEVTESNYDELVITPKQNVLLLTYDNDDRRVRKIFDDLAVAFRNDEQVTICAIDVDKYPNLHKERFGHRHLPAVFWFEHNNKHKKFLFGGKYTAVVLLLFVNEKTHLWRRIDGQLEKRSGRIEELDNIFKRYIPEIKEVEVQKIYDIISEMQNVEVKQSWETDFAEYYVTLMEKIAEHGEPMATLNKERDVVVNMINDRTLDLTQKQRDFFLRKYNVVAFMMDSIQTYDEAKHREEEENRKAKEKEAPKIKRLRRIKTEL